MLLIAENANLRTCCIACARFIEIGPNANDDGPLKLNQGGFPGGLKSIAALPRRAMITLPRTNLSIFVLRKQSSNASSGLQTTGSFSLKDVLSTIGMPVRSRKLSINL